MLIKKINGFDMKKWAKNERYTGKKSLLRSNNKGNIGGLGEERREPRCIQMNINK